MRPLVIAMLIGAAMLTSCEKEKPVNRMSYTLASANDSSFGEQTVINFSVQQTGGDLEDVNIALVDYPSAFTVDYSVDRAKPPFSGTITIHTDSASVKWISLWRKNRMTLSASTITKDIRHDIVFAYAPTDGSYTFANRTYVYYNLCAPHDYPVSLTASMTRDSVNKLKLQHFTYFNTTLSAYIQPQTKTITIPPQIVSGNFYTGTGRFSNANGTADSFYIDYKVYNGTDTNVCSAVLVGN